MSDPSSSSEPIQIGAKATQSVVCAQCQQQVPAGQYYAYKGPKGADIFLCGTCRSQAEQAFQAETQNPNLIGAIVLGTLAGSVAGVVWHFFVVITGYEIGYVAIGVGLVVGWGVHLGSGKKRAPSLQILSAVLTLSTLLIANYFTFLHFLRKQFMHQNVEGYSGEFFFISPFEPMLWKSMISPMSFVIWAIALYVAFSVSKPRTL